MTRLGYQLPNFTYPGGNASTVFSAVVAQAKAADTSGFDSVLLMDHLYQLPQLGSTDEMMLECYTTLSALAQHTSTVRLGALVTGNTYRNPGLLAKIVSTLDVISGGRAMLNIGCGWYEREHVDFGYEFGSFTDRFERLEEALQIIVPMLRGEPPTLTGTHYRANAIVNSPRPLSRVPVMVGGNGERKTLRMAAQYGDLANLICSPEDVPRKVEALEERCSEVGRRRDELTLSWTRRVCIAPTMEQARAELTPFLTKLGIDYENLDHSARANVESTWVLGDPDTVGEVLSNDLALGVEGYTLSLVANGHDPERVNLLGETARAVVSGP